jgi:VIT1/CCC1 family predicted Fe2+/Mn2+ transporter
MSLNKWTFKISDPEVNAEFKIYMQKNAAKYMPVQVTVWFFATLWQIIEMKSDEMAKGSVFLIGVITIFSLSLLSYFLIKKFLWTIEVSAVLTYLATALLITYTNYSSDEEYLPADVKKIVSCNAVMHSMHLYVLLFNSNYIVS